MPSGSYQYISISEQQRRRQRIRRAIEIVIFVCFVAIPIGIISIDGASLPNKLLALKPGKPGFKTWLNPPITTVRNYHLFNVTNPDEFLRKPKLMLNISDSRPYVYDVKTNRKNIQWHENDTEMSYEVERIFARHPKLFDPASLKDRGHFVNMVRTLIRSKFGVTPSAAIGAALDGEPPFRDDPIEILEGYVSDSSRKVQERMVGPNTEKYGLVYRQNGSRLYNMTIRTDLFIKGQMLEFASELSAFKVSRAENYPYPVYDGLTFPAMLFNQTRINVFNSDFCRPIRIEYNGTVSKFGFGTIYKYVLKLIDFNSCTDPTDDRTCPEVDKIDVSKCLSDTLEPNTIFISKAHFYGSSPETVEELKIHGLNPSADKHDSIIYFEPYTGTPIQATYRIQMNVVAKIDPMKRNEAGTWDFTFKKSEPRTLPVFWIEQRVEVSRGTVWKLRIVTMLIKGPSPWIIFPLFIGLAILIIGTIEICARRFGY